MLFVLFAEFLYINLLNIIFLKNIKTTYRCLKVTQDIQFQFIACITYFQQNDEETL